MKQIGWKAKLNLLSILILSASLFLQVFYIIPFIQDKDMENEKAQQEEITQNIARELEISLDRLVNKLEFIVKHAVFRNMDIDNQTEVLIQYTNMSSEINNLFVLNETGWFVSGTPDNMSVYYTKSYAYKDYFIAAFEQGKIFFSMPRAYYSNTLITTSISVPIISNTGERIGILMGTMNLNDIILRIADYPLKEDQVVFLIDNKNTVIAHSAIDLFSLVDGPLSLNYSAHHLVQEKSAGEVIGTHEYSNNGTSYIGVILVLESNDWGIVVETSRITIMSESNTLVMNLWIFNIALFITALTVTMLFTNQIISMQKRSTNNLRELQEKLIRKEKLAILGELAGGVGHELRNPLGAIKNATYFLNMVLEEPKPEIKESLDIIEKEIERSEKIISSLLDYARPRPISLQKMDINDVILKSLARINIPEKVKVVSLLNKALPTIEADSGQLSQIFNNIISNAIQAMPEGGHLVIKSDVSSPDWVTISIKDTGVGISKNNLKKLFEPLFTTKAKGIGLGLAITKTLIEGHGGSINVHSEKGKNTIFTVKLPIRKKEIN